MPARELLYRRLLDVSFRAYVHIRRTGKERNGMAVEPALQSLTLALCLERIDTCRYNLHDIIAQNERNNSTR